MKVRRQKLDNLISKGINPFGEKFDRTHNAADIVDNYDELEGQDVVVADGSWPPEATAKLVSHRSRT